MKTHKVIFVLLSWLVMVPFDLIGYIAGCIHISLKYGYNRAGDHLIKLNDWVKK